MFLARHCTVNALYIVTQIAANTNDFGRLAKKSEFIFAQAFALNQSLQKVIFYQ